MRLIALLAGSALLAGAANAQYRDYERHGVYGAQSHCETVRKENRVGGAIAGALIGGLAGGAIGNNVEDGDRGWYRGRGYRGHRRWHYDRGNGNSDEVAAGAIIGAIIGGVAGSEIASSNTRCATRTYGSVPPPTRSAHGTGWESPRPVYTDPHAARDLYGGRDYDRYEDGRINDFNYERETRGYRVGHTDGRYDDRDYGYEDDYRSDGGRECRTVTRTTTLPSGEPLREDVQACRDHPNDDWALQ